MGEYGKDFIKIRFESDDNLPLNKTLKLHILIVNVRSVFEKDGKYYRQIFQTNVCMSYENAAPYKANKY